MRLNIFLYSFLLLCSTSVAKADGDDIIKLKAMLVNMSIEYSECAAIFMNFVTVAEQTSGDSAELKDLQQKTYDTKFAAKKFREMAGLNPEATEDKIAKMYEDFNKELTQGNNQDKYAKLGLKCKKMAEKPDEYLQSMKSSYGLQKY